MAELEKTKALIRSVLISEPAGIPMHRFRQDYKEITLQELPLLGYRNVEELCLGLRDVIRVQKTSNLLFGVSDSRTQHVEVLIANQKKKKRSRARANTNSYRGHSTSFHRSRSSHNPRPRSNSSPHISNQPQRAISYPPISSKHHSNPKRASTPPHSNFPRARNSNPNQRFSVFDRLRPVPPAKPTPRPTQELYSPPPARVLSSNRTVSFFSGDSLHSPLPTSPYSSSKNWSIPPNSPTWRHEYSDARTYSLTDLPNYARPGELIFVIGYFKGERRMEDRVLESGRVLKLNTLRFRIYKTLEFKNSVLCTFSFPNWAISTYNSPNQIKEGTWVKVYGTYDNSSIAVNYLEVYDDVTHEYDHIPVVAKSMSTLSINNKPPLLQDTAQNERSLSSASDTSVFTDSEITTAEEDESHDQGYSSPINPRVDFPPASSISPSNVPNEFYSRVKSISTLTHFYLILDDTNGVLENLTDRLTSLQQGIKPDSILIPGECKDLLCSAFNVTSSKWHRARFLNNYPRRSSTYAVSFIDLGEETQVPEGYIRPFHPEYLQLTAQALPCSLPLPKNMASDTQLIAFFRKIVSNIPLKTRVNKQHDNKFQVDLTTPDGKNIVSEIMSAFTDRNATFDNDTLRMVSHPDHFKFDINSELSPTDRQSEPFIDNYIPPNEPNRYSIAHNSFVDSLSPLQNDGLVYNKPTHINIPGPQADGYTIQSNSLSTHGPIAAPINQLSNGIRPPTRRLQSSLSISNYSGPLNIRPVMTSYSYDTKMRFPTSLASDLQKLVHFETLPITNNFEGIITSIISPDKFYIQNCERRKELAKFSSLLQFYGTVNKQSTLPTGSVIEFCLGLSRNKQWVRVQVQNWNSSRSEAQVLLLDYGTEETIHLGNLLKLATNHFQLPFQAILVKLDGIQPLDTTWTDSTISRFRNLTIDKVMRVYPKLPSPAIVLTDTTLSPSVDVHKLLISEGLAKASI
ncbi:Tudor domain-containing protein 1 [Oopsacas minuta]|uniref:Tudor domain-containing protein 1 n=1 Tax=Oopsacas minuta TaxID=111878 RepID=A0AAV7K3S1_9METZ|nr:Tudor domain-containing protein 1 [Oopsacas minuta]